MDAWPGAYLCKRMYLFIALCGASLSHMIVYAVTESMHLLMQVRSELCAPIFDKAGKIIGIIDVEVITDRNFLVFVSV